MNDDVIAYLSVAIFLVVMFWIQKRRLTRINQNNQVRIDQEREFLENNKTADGILTTSSGLQYKIIEEGDGQHFPAATSRVKVHYHGTLIDGTVFDSSVQRGQPITFGLNQVITGWTEGLQLMSVGTKARLFIAPDLGYGKRATGKIPVSSTLIFDVELLAIES